MRSINEQMNQFPTHKDFEKAATKFLRLQDIYQLDLKTLTKGLLGSLKGLSLNSELIILLIPLVLVCSNALILFFHV